MPATSPTSSVILGAGFSHVAGLPLAKDLLDVQVFASSREAGRRYRRVWEAWDAYRESNPDRGPEFFLSDLFAGRDRVRDSFGGKGLWPWAVELVGAALASPRGADVPVVRNMRYSGRITTPVRVAAHSDFWEMVIGGSSLQSVVTTNYDLLAERGVRHRPMKRPARPGFYYGGLPHPQRLKGLAQPWTIIDPQRVVTLTGSVPVFKLHGSLNWARERGSLVMYQDQRPAFRFESPAQIVPPVPEKETPAWLSPVWDGARNVLRESDVWIVCGYSLPAYDRALQRMFADSTRSRSPSMIFLLDPLADEIADRWQVIAPSAEVISLDGLPQGTNRLQDALGSIIT